MISLAINGSGSVMCRNINYICDKYNMDKYNLCDSHLGSICKMCEPTESGQAVRCFLLYRNSLAYGSEDYNNISEIIRVFCEE